LIQLLKAGSNFQSSPWGHENDLCFFFLTSFKEIHLYTAQQGGFLLTALFFLSRLKFLAFSAFAAMGEGCWGFIGVTSDTERDECQLCQFSELVKEGALNRLDVTLMLLLKGADSRIRFVNINCRISSFASPPSLRDSFRC